MIREHPFIEFILIQVAALMVWVLSLNLSAETLIRYYSTMILVLLWCKE